MNFSMLLVIPIVLAVCLEAWTRLTAAQVRSIPHGSDEACLTPIGSLFKLNKLRILNGIQCHFRKSPNCFELMRSETIRT